MHLAIALVNPFYFLKYISLFFPPQLFNSTSPLFWSLIYHQYILNPRSVRSHIHDFSSFTTRFSNFLLTVSFFLHYFFFTQTALRAVAFSECRATKRKFSFAIFFASLFLFSYFLSAVFVCRTKQHVCAVVAFCYTVAQLSDFVCTFVYYHTRYILIYTYIYMHVYFCLCAQKDAYRCAFDGFYIISNDPEL